MIHRLFIVLNKDEKRGGQGVETEYASFDVINLQIYVTIRGKQKEISTFANVR